MLGAVGAVVAFDDSIQDFTQGNRSDTLDKLADLGEPFGSGSVSLGLIGGGFAAGLVTDDVKLQETALLGFQGFVLTSALILGLKLATYRAWPRSGEDFKSFDGPGTERDNRSVPSGHAARAFTLATVLASQYDGDLYGRARGLRACHPQRTLADQRRRALGLGCRVRRGVGLRHRQAGRTHEPVRQRIERSPSPGHAPVRSGPYGRLQLLEKVIYSGWGRTPGGGSSRKISLSNSWPGETA